MTQTQRARRRLNLLEIIYGLLIKPSATMWRLRDEGLLWHSFLAAVILGGLGFTNGQWLERLTGHSQPLWASWLVGLLVTPVVLLANMLLIHVASLIVWRFSDRPVHGASFTTLLRLGGYGAMPSVTISIISNALMLAAVRTGSFDTARLAYLGALPIALAGMAWALVFSLRLLKTVYLTSWGNAFTIMILASLLTWAVLGSTSSSLYGVAVVRVDWDAHVGLGADPALVRVLRQLPQAGAGSVGASAHSFVVPLRGAPVIGDVVAYYPAGEAPPWRRGRRLSDCVPFGVVVARAGEETSLGVVPQASVAIREPYGPDGTQQLVPLANIAGIAVSTSYWTHKTAARLLR